MKKAKLMLGVVALSAVLLGTGYAVMTDVITINGTVNTANFDVDFVDDIRLVEDVAQNLDGYATKHIHVVDDDTSDILEFIGNNLKPGTSVTYETTMQNMSSIDAQLKSIEVEGAQGTIGGIDINECIEVKVVLTGSTINKAKVFEGTLANFSSASNITDVILQESGIVNEEDLVKVQITIGLKDVEYAADEAGTTKNIAFKILFNWEQTGVAK